MNCNTTKPYPEYEYGSGVENNQVCRQAGEENWCNLCKCTAGGKVQCQKKTCSSRVEDTGYVPATSSYHKCKYTKCSFMYKDNDTHDDADFNPHTDADNVK